MSCQLIRIGIAFLMLDLLASPSLCEDTASSNAAKFGVPDHTSVDDEARDEFRRIVCDAAIDDQSPIQGEAIRIVSKRKFTDPRFDDYVRRPFGAESSAAAFNAAFTLLSVSTLSKGEKVDLLLNSLVTWNDEFESDAKTKFSEWSSKKPYVEKINQTLGTMRHELASELKERLAAENPPTILIAAAELTREKSLPLIPLLLEFAKNGSAKCRVVAVSALDQSIWFLDQAGLELARKKSPVEHPEEKTTAYATKIIERFDTDGDQCVSPSEWNKMLIDPSPADTDQDGKVTIQEFASFMLKRSQR